MEFVPVYTVAGIALKTSNSIWPNILFWLEIRNILYNLLTNHSLNLALVVAVFVN
jgi:hypothetical protein